MGGLGANICSGTCQCINWIPDIKCYLDRIIVVVILDQAFSQMAIQAPCGWPLIIENCFIFHMLPYKLFT